MFYRQFEAAIVVELGANTRAICIPTVTATFGTVVVVGRVRRRATTEP